MSEPETLVCFEMRALAYREHNLYRAHSIENTFCRYRFEMRALLVTPGCKTRKRIKGISPSVSSTTKCLGAVGSRGRRVRNERECQM